MSEPTYRTYRIRTYEDMEMIPQDRIEAFLVALRDILAHTREIQLRDGFEKDGWSWCDDGKTDIALYDY